MFGDLWIVDNNGDDWYIANDVAEALGYNYPADAILDHCQGVSETLVPSNGGMQLTKIITTSDVSSRARHRKLPGAKKVEYATINVSNGNTISKVDSIPLDRRGNPNVLIINDSGLSTLAFRSNKPGAKRFRRWVTREVLPSIRLRVRLRRPVWVADLLWRLELNRRVGWGSCASNAQDFRRTATSD